MSTFYLLSSRCDMGESACQFFHTLFPTLDPALRSPDEAVDWLVAIAEQQAEVFVVFREDVPEKTDLPLYLQEIYGAEEGDTVIEVHNLLDKKGENQVWQIDGKEREEAMA